MLVKTIVSAAGADFTIEFGQEFQFSDLQALIGNGAENFCVPVEDGIEWPPAVVDLAAESVTADVTTDEPAVDDVPAEQAVESPADIPEVAPSVEVAVEPAPTETATKGRRK